MERTSMLSYQSNDISYLLLMPDEQDKSLALVTFFKSSALTPFKLYTVYIYMYTIYTVYMCLYNIN